MTVSYRILARSQLNACSLHSIHSVKHGVLKGEPGSSVGIATYYGLESQGLNPGEDEIFRPSRPALGPTQPPVQWVPCLSPR